ncbi:MAG: hypothetical protein OEP48_08215, partial [Betaproteobacteria bacterium]|nr:hypothetical protein [Betaproteobacteria bacterium]
MSWRVARCLTGSAAGTALPARKPSPPFKIAGEATPFCYNFPSRDIMHLIIASLLLALASSHAQTAPLPVPPVPA